jgi:hypothetical protein
LDKEDFMAAKAYTVLVGLLLLVVGLLGFMGRVPLHLHHNLFHAASGIAALAVALVWPKHAQVFARLFGAIYVLLALLGFAGVSDIGPLHFNLNAAPVLYVHSAVGIAGLLAGFLGKKKSAPSQLKAAA